jgi:hypothetical protein
MQSLLWTSDSTSCCVAERDTAVEVRWHKATIPALQLVEYCTHILPGIVAGRPAETAASDARGKSRQNPCGFRAWRAFPLLAPQLRS